MFEKYMVYVILLFVIPGVFSIWYKWHVKRKELEARKARTPVADKFLVALEEGINAFEPGFGNNSEIPIECINDFLSYGITIAENGKTSCIDRNKHECLFWKTTGGIL